MPATPTLHLTDAQIDEAALRQAVHDTARTAQDARRGVRGVRAGRLPCRVTGGVGRGSWGGHGSDEDEPDEGKEATR